MDEINNKDPGVGNGTSTPDVSPIAKPKTRGKKRKRIESDSGSDSDTSLPENALEVEKNVIASAMKNNLDDVSVKKILKKVVTNDHVLALVKLREEEESNTEDIPVIPKLTRSKVKELTKASPKSAPWNLQNLELTPIKHIPVKTRPEVKALIAQELPEDEDDEEYEPTHDDVPSDDDQGLESCSDLDSQPRTPITPRSQQRVSPKVVKDGPFKVPQEVSTPTRRRLELEEEEATIALRTRSKLCLSETPIEHIESSFVPPDDLPVPVVDDHLWNEFLNDCLNPASVSKHEDDDETDPEYNVAADPDAPDDDDEDALERSILKISKKELNDLVTEIFNIMPEQAVEDELAVMASSVLADEDNNATSSRWEGKQEPVSEDEGSVKMVDRIVFERRNSITKFSVGKTEPVDSYDDYDKPESQESPAQRKKSKGITTRSGAVLNNVDIRMEERAPPAAARAPAPVKRAREPAAGRLQVLLENKIAIRPEQIQILQQQLRQHIQLATSNFLQLCVHPIHWAQGPTYKEYLEALVKIADSNPDSVVKVCNLKPALELCETWEQTVSADTPENKEMVKFVKEQSDRSQRRMQSNSYYAGDFHETFLRTVANSTVFLYPYLLPPMPYRPVACRRFSYVPSEDALIAIGLDQFWDYVDSNPQLFKKPSRPKPQHRWGLSHTVDLVIKHMFPWLSHKVLLGHIMHVRRVGSKDNPIPKFFANRTVEAVKHRLVPFNPSLTLYEQPEHEMPRVWLRYLAQHSKRFKLFLYRKRSTRATFIGAAPVGVEINPGLPAELTKNPLPIDFTKEIKLNRPNDVPLAVQKDKFDLNIQKATVATVTSLYKLVETSSGINLVPLELLTEPVKGTDTNTVSCNVAPISSAVASVNTSQRNVVIDATKKNNSDHCQCCLILKTITKQKVITDYFRSSSNKSEPCGCRQRRYPKISNKLRLLVDRYKRRSDCIYRDLMNKLEELKDGKSCDQKDDDYDGASFRNNADDLAIATAFEIKLNFRLGLAKTSHAKRSVYNKFVKFDPHSDDPVKLANQLEETFKTDMVDLYKEFLGFMTAEQADKMGKFREYFTLNCVEGLVEKIEEHVSEPVRKQEILSELRSSLGDARGAEGAGGGRGSCGACGALLARMRGLPALARYTFGLFPHRRLSTPPTNTSSTKEPGTSTQAEQQPIDEEPADDTLNNDDTAITAPDYEADHSSSGEDESEAGSESAVPNQKIQADPPEAQTEEKENGPDPQPTPCNADTTDDSSEMSMIIMSEDESIKTEPQEWKREEDKLILEYVLQANMKPARRKDQTIMEILEEENVIETLSQALTNKSLEALKERVEYLLNVLTGSETKS